MSNRFFVSFFVTVGFFIFFMTCLLYIKLTWDKPLPQEEAAVEINLPVIQWNQYLNLSKSIK